MLFFFPAYLFLSSLSSPDYLLSHVVCKYTVAAVIGSFQVTIPLKAVEMRMESFEE